MVATGVIFPQGMPIKASAPVSFAPSDRSDSVTSNDHFARMLDQSSSSDTSTTSSNSTVKPTSSTSGSTNATDQTASSDTANDAAPSTPTIAVVTANDRARIITPKEAAAILQKLGSTGTDTPETTTDADSDNAAAAAAIANGAADGNAQQQLKDQLTDIVTNQTPKSVGEILDNVNNAADDAPATPSLPVADASASAETNATTLGQTAIRVFQLVNKALGTVAAATPPQQTATQETPAQGKNATVDAQALNPALLSLQAVTFPAGDDAKKADTAKEKTDDADQATVTLITPLSQVQVLAPTQGTAAPITAVDSQTLAANDDVNSRIPGLGLPKQKAALPDVSLPQASFDASNAADAPASTDLSGFTKQLEALGTGMQPIAKPVAAQNANDNNQSVTTAANAINGLTAATGVLTAQAVAPAAPVLATGIINHAPVTDQVSIAVSKASADGIDQMTVQLDPKDLGRIEVKMHTAKDGTTSLSFLVDKPETFDALSRDARSLEKSLQESGIKADTSGMQFNLRQQPQPQSGTGTGHGQGQAANATPDTSTADKSAAITPITPTHRINIHDGIDIHA